MLRGNQKQVVFCDEADYFAFLKRLKKYKRLHSFLLYGFCLMPNHVHMIGEPREPKRMAAFMQSLNISYVAYFNKRHKKVGHLWQDRYKSKIITKDDYLRDCIGYIEQNPVRAQLVSSAHDYPWSSYTERVFDKRVNGGMLDHLRL